MLTNSDSQLDQQPRPIRLYLQFFIFFSLFGLWTWKLLEPYPIPEDLRAELDAIGLSFILAKSLHAGIYAFLTLLAGTLPIPLRWRNFLIVLLVCHGVATEIGQRFVPNRHGRYQDVLIDWGGIIVGVFVLLVWRRWQSRSLLENGSRISG